VYLILSTSLEHCFEVVVRSDPMLKARIRVRELVLGMVRILSCQGVPTDSSPHVNRLQVKDSLLMAE